MYKFFPCILIGLDLGEGIVYFADGDIRRGIYWVAVAALTACVTFYN